MRQSPPDNWKDLFIAELAVSPNVGRAARAAGISRQGAYKAREADPEFSEDWDDALADSLDDVESAVYQRARIESDTLAIFLLKSHRRAIYGDQSKLELTGKGGGPVEILAAIDKIYASDDDEESADDPGG